MSTLRLLIRPTIFTAGFCGACYCGAAIVQYENRRQFFPKRLEDVQDWLAAKKQRSEIGRKYLNLRNKVNSYVNQLSTSEKIAGGAVFINLLVFSGWRIRQFQPVMMKFFTSRVSTSKIPLSPMILSCFSQSAAVHFIFNMMALWSFSPLATQLLGPEQLIGMYLSAGAVSSLASIANRVIIKSTAPSLGASGALLGVIAYICMKCPDAALLIFFVPVSAGNAIKALIAFDFAGLLAKWRLLDHAGHLGGSLFGIWYATYGEKLFAKHKRSVVDQWLSIKSRFE